MAYTAQLWPRGESFLDNLGQVNLRRITSRKLGSLGKTLGQFEFKSGASNCDKTQSNLWQARS